MTSLTDRNDRLESDSGILIWGTICSISSRCHPVNRYLPWMQAI